MLINIDNGYIIHKGSLNECREQKSLYYNELHTNIISL